MKIGIFGGTFNPIHKGHIEMIKKVKINLNLNLVFIVPSYKTADKNFSVERISAKDRLKMVKKSVYDEKLSWLKVSNFEQKNKRVSYTYLTIEYFKKKYKNDDLFWIMGEDRYSDFNKWENVDKIRKNSSIVIYRRNPEINEKIKKDKSVIYIVDEYFDFSSTKILNEIRWDFIPDAAKKYICKKKLYLKTLAFNVLKEKRYEHSIAVASHAKRLSKEYKYKNIKNAWYAGLVHDLFKYHDKEFMIEYINKKNKEGWIGEKIPSPALHGFVAALWIRYEYGWFNKEIFDAIASHTLSKANTTKIDKIIYVADKISTDRKGHLIGKIRKLAYLNLDETYIKLLKRSIKKIEKKGSKVHDFTIQAVKENIDNKYKNSKYEYNLKENRK